MMRRGATEKRLWRRDPKTPKVHTAEARDHLPTPKDKVEARRKAVTKRRKAKRWAKASKRRNR